MPLVQINAGPAGLVPDPDAETRLRTALHALPKGAPVVILIHGFKFSPSHPARSPHRHILALDPASGCRKALSWPRALGFGDDTADGLCIAFGWEASGSIWRAYGQAARTGAALARLIATIRHHSPGRQVDILAHSLGARVTLAALPHLQAGALRHAILMAPAETRSQARAALDTPAGRAAAFLTVASGENTLYDLLLEWLVAPHRPGDRSLGQAGFTDRANWLTLRIDSTATLQALRDLGFPVAAPERRICHWSPYLRPGMFGLYTALLRADFPLEHLRMRLPDTPQPRRSRRVARPRLPLPLPFAGKAPS
ncbi:alpha/beta hydrolase [Actibacterium ureilyticum]|uniref:alpha/beta hydrolase n=1 Tax=Actibacterium ureilyticum TaxID=1590614 RepID=UPI000BAADD11|nr:alpha/beta hydrolase [Actibacterium ureilyticum]